MGAGALETCGWGGGDWRLLVLRALRQLEIRRQARRLNASAQSQRPTRLNLLCNRPRRPPGIQMRQVRIQTVRH